MKVICFVNQKGGVGKTASAVNVGAGLARAGRKVLLIDLDPQESLSYWLGIEEPVRTAYDLFEGRAGISDCKVAHKEGFDVVPSNELLATCDPDVEIMRTSLRGQNYDFVILDCSPTLGMTTLSALTAADWVVIPLSPDLLSIKGMSQLLGTIETVQAQTNPGLRLKAIIATKHSERKRMHRDILTQLHLSFPDVAIYTVRENIAIAESPAAGSSIFGYKPKCTGAKDYEEIVRGLLDGV